MVNWNERVRAAGVHLLASLCIAALAAALVFAVWFPFPYREISGGRDLFILLVAVDVIIGPLVTLTVYNRAKPLAELRRDLLMVVLLQLTALGYGMWQVSLARPVHLVFEIDRFRVVHAAEVPMDLLAQTPQEVEALPWLGPTLIAVRPFRDERERMAATVAAVRGLSIGSRPDFWTPYAPSRTRVIAAGTPIASLKAQVPMHARAIDEAVGRTGQAAEALLAYPLVSRRQYWTVLLDRQTAEPRGFISVDTFP